MIFRIVLILMIPYQKAITMSYTPSQKRPLTLLLTPSWLSGLLAVTAGLVVSVGVIIVFSLNNSSVQQQLIAWQSTKAGPALTTPDHTLPENDHPTLRGSWPLILVWSL